MTTAAAADPTGGAVRPGDDGCLACEHPFSGHPEDARAYCATTVALSFDGKDVNHRGCACPPG